MSSGIRRDDGHREVDAAISRRIAIIHEKCSRPIDAAHTHEPDTVAWTDWGDERTARAILQNSVEKPNSYEEREGGVNGVNDAAQ